MLSTWLAVLPSLIKVSLKPGENSRKGTCVIISSDCGSRKDYLSQGLPRFSEWYRETSTISSQNACGGNG